MKTRNRRRGAAALRPKLFAGAAMLCPLLVAVLVLTACAEDDPTSTPYLDPTATTQITPAPLLLTPIATPQPLPEIPPLPDAGQSSKSLAVHDDLLVTVNSDSDSITVLRAGRVVDEISVGDDPRTVAITPAGDTAVVTLRGEHAIAIVDLGRATASPVPVCHMPYGVVTDERRAFVSCFGDDRIAVVDLETREVSRWLDVRDAPAGLALSGGWLLITHFYTGHVTLANVQTTPFVIGATNAEPDGELARAIIIRPDGQRAYIPQTRTGLALVSLQYMQDWFPVVTALDVPTMSGLRDQRLTVSQADTIPSNMPFDLAYDAGRLWVVLAGNDRVVVINEADYEVLARIDVGANPRGIVIADGVATVHNVLDGTITRIDTATYTVIDTITVTEIPLDPVLLRGKILYHNADAPTMSDGAISCATCHFDGGADGRTWINFRAGPRNTPALGGVHAMPPFHWAGDMAELQDTMEDTIRLVMLGDGLIEGEFDPTIDRVDAGRSADLDALAAYVTSLEPWPSPYREPDGGLSEAAQRGAQLFMSGSPSCSCHTPPLYTDLQQHNLAGATFSTEVYGDFDTPTLRGLWATAPYMHDGVPQTLEEALTRTDPIHSVADDLTPQQLRDLIAFLLSL